MPTCGEFGAGKHRGEVVGQPEDRRSAYRHRGRFDAQVLPLLDAAPGGQPSGQFAYRLTKDGKLRGGSSDCSEASFTNCSPRSR
jgi:hypothetical protein